MVTLSDGVEPVEEVAEPASRSYLSISQAAELLGVSRVSIWRWIRAGHLPVVRLGHRTVRIKREDLERLPIHIGPSGYRTRTMAEARSDQGSGRRAAVSAGADRFVQFSEFVV